MTVKRKDFTGGMLTSWGALLDQAQAFAGTMGRERLITITVTGTGKDNTSGLVTVWYWG